MTWAGMVDSSLGIKTRQYRSTSRAAIKRVLRPEIKRYLKERFELDWRGIHGMPHWWRVLRSGVWIAESECADIEVVAWFAILHDHCRADDGDDPDHGVRAAEATQDLLAKGVIEIEQRRAGILLEAIEGHADGCTHRDPTIASCWDADRLDLPRVGVRPVARLLSTATARRLLTERSSREPK